MSIDEAWSKSLEIGKEISETMMNECDGSYIGAEQTVKFEIKNKNYKVTIVAFWEKRRHFDCDVTGVDNNYERYECCIDF